MARPSLSSLPLELLLNIIDHLGFPDNANLRATGRSFLSLIPSQPTHYLHLLAAEDSAWAVRHRRLTCVYCARMRPASAFTDHEKCKTEKHGAESRCCYECARAYETYEVKSLESCTPFNQTRTQFCNQTRINIDGVERAICKWCHNSFERWGSKSAKRKICPGCFHDDPTESTIRKCVQYEKDVLKMEQKRRRNNFGRRPLGIICNGDDILSAIIDDEDWWDSYEFFVTPAPAVIPVWRGGKRGVVVRSREKAEELYFESRLPEEYLPLAKYRCIGDALRLMLADENERGRC